MQCLLERTVSSFRSSSAAFKVIVPFGLPGNFIEQSGIVFNTGMGAVSADFFQMFTKCDIIGLVKIFYACSLHFNTLFITAESLMLAFCIKAIGSGSYTTGSI